MESNLDKKYIDLAVYSDNKDIYTLDEMITQLMKAKFKGDLVSGSFDNHMFYSDSITFDSAYLECYDMTKKEYDYYINNTYSIMRDILLNGITDLVVDRNLYIYCKNEILTAKTPYVLQVYHLMTMALTDSFAGLNDSVSIDRFNKINNQRKQLASNFIEKYFSDTFKSYSIDLLKLNEYVRKRENKN